MKNTNKVMINTSAFNAVLTIMGETHEHQEGITLPASTEELRDQTFIDALASTFYSNLCEELSDISFAEMNNGSAFTLLYMTAWEFAIKTAKDAFDGVGIPEEYFCDLVKFVKNAPSVFDSDSYSDLIRYTAKMPDISNYSAEASTVTPMRTDVDWCKITETAKRIHKVKMLFAKEWTRWDSKHGEYEDWRSDLATDIALIAKSYIEEVVVACCLKGAADIIGHAPEYIEKCVNLDRLIDITSEVIGVTAA